MFLNEIFKKASSLNFIKNQHKLGGCGHRFIHATLVCLIDVLGGQFSETNKRPGPDKHPGRTFSENKKFSNGALKSQNF